MEVKVAAVFGDDILPQHESLKSNGNIKRTETNNLLQLIYGYMIAFAPIEGNEEEWPEGKKLDSLNAYLGADPIRRALDMGAQVVVTGRVVDSALVLGPLMYEFKWSVEDYDRLAAGTCHLKQRIPLS